MLIPPPIVGNCFQSNLQEVEQRVYVKAPPLYIEWFRDRYPKHPLPLAKTCYVLQAVHSIQGTRSAGNEWYEFGSKIFKKMGMVQNATDNAVFTFRLEDDLLIVLTNVDDFLILASRKEIYVKVKNKLASMFDITTQEGNIINFLNLRIVSSTTAISIDQTKHILELVEPHFPRLQHFSKTHTPMRTDKMFEYEFADALPTDKEDLQNLEIEFGGSYLTLYGKLLHVATISRPQTCNALSRLGKFQSCPNRFGFVCLRRIIQYLATYPNVPLIYPKQELSTLSPIACFHKQQKMDLPHVLSQFIDSNYATDLSDRKSVSSDIILLGAVAVSWKVNKDMSLASSTTDAETRAAFRGIKRLIVIRNFIAHLGFPINYPTPVYEDNKGTHDVIQAGRNTPGIKHIDVPLCYLHEKHKSGEFEVKQCSTHLMLADGLNKALTSNSITTHSNIYTGRRFLPPPSSEHYKELVRLCPLS